MVGKTVGQYAIQETLGQGGMGTVYKAEDLKLRRSVALKFLSPGAVQDAESRSRFLQEAQAAAALDHPNICGVYQIDEYEGSWFIAMPYVEGKGLDEQIASGPQPYQKAVELARQIAEGLEEAHSQEIIHRDVKPANVIVSERSRGRLQVTIMDFGLARLANATRLTREGRQMGTAAYMSPEQVMGTPVDQRTDIWSLGVVLYEMTVGQVPFPADYEQALFYGIQNEEPEPLTSLRTGVPMELERIVTKCLAKDPSERYQTCTDLLVDLNALARELNDGRSRTSRKSGSVSPATDRVAVETVPGDSTSVLVSSAASPSSAEIAPPSSPAASEQPGGTGFSLGQTLAAAAVVGALAAGAAWMAATAAPESAQSAQGQSYELTRITWDGQLSAFPALSPDGRLLAYSSDRAGNGDLDLWIQQVDGGGLVRLTDHPADDKEAVFSPDGTQIAFARTGNGLYTIPAIGGEPYLVAQGAQSPDFSPDGKKIAYTKSGPDGGIFFSPVSMGEPKQLFEYFRALNSPLWAPDGQSVLAWGRSADGQVDWWSAPIDGGEPRPLQAAAVFQSVGAELSGEVWRRSGNTILITAQDAELYRLTIADDGSSVSDPVRITVGAGLEVLPTMATDGRIAFTDAEQRRDVWALSISTSTGLASGEPERITSSEASDTAGDVTDDGNLLVYISNRWGRRDIWTKNLTTGEEENVSNDREEQRAPLLSPEGDRIAYMVREGEKSVIYARPFGGGAGHTLCDDCGAPRYWTPDGRFILYDRHPGVYVLELSTKRTSLIAGSDDTPVHHAAVSPDGRWIAFRAGGAEGGIRVAQFGVTETIQPDSWETVVEDGEAHCPVWSPDGRRLYFTSAAEGSRDLWMVALDASKKTVGEPQLVRRFPNLRYSLDLMSFNDRQLSFGGGKLFFPMSELSGDIWLMEPRNSSDTAR